MKSVVRYFALPFVIAFAIAGCNPASDLTEHEGVISGSNQQSLRAEYGERSAIDAPARIGQRPDRTFGNRGATCPCFSRASLANADRMVTAGGAPASDYYLFFDVFNYYGLDARRTEARALVSTPVGPFEEVAAVYISRGSEDELFLICHRQEVVRDPITGDPEYRYSTLAPDIEEAEACRETIYASVEKQEPCQGPACGMAYTKGHLDPDFPLYGDGDYRTPKSLLDTMRQRVDEVRRMLRVPA